MKKILPKFLLFISLLSFVSCTLTKRKYTGGFYVSWHKKAPQTKIISQEKISPYTREAVLRGQEKSTLGLPNNNISATYKVIIPRSATSRVREIPKNISNSTIGTLQNHANSPSNEGSMGSPASDKRFLDNGLTGFEAAVINLIVLGMLILFLKLNYAVFIIGCILLILGFSIYSLVYCFKGLNSNDKHRGLALAGLFIDIGVMVTLLVLAL